MPSHGEMRQCPNCLQPKMAWERWLNTDEDHGECLFCGFFYEKTWVSLLAQRLSREEPVPDEALQKWLAEHLFHVSGTVAFRMGMLPEEEDSEAESSIFHTWFDVPSPHAKYSSGVEWIDLSAEEWQPFDCLQWKRSESRGSRIGGRSVRRWQVRFAAGAGERRWGG